MLFLDMPNMPPQTPAIVMVAQTNQAQGSTKTSERVLGVCGVIANEQQNYPNSFRSYATVAAEMYLWKYEHRNGFTPEDRLAAKTIILQQPKHGTLVEIVTNPDLSGDYRYTPEAGYVGSDSAVVLVEIKGMKVKVHYFLHVLSVPEPNPYDNNCGEKGGRWKISLASSSIVQIEQTGLTLRSSGTAQKRAAP